MTETRGTWKDFSWRIPASRLIWAGALFGVLTLGVNASPALATNADDLSFCGAVGQRECCRTEEVGRVRRRCDSGVDRAPVDNCVAIRGANNCGPGDCANAICVGTADELTFCGGEGQRECCRGIDVDTTIFTRRCDSGIDRTGQCVGDCGFNNCSEKICTSGNANDRDFCGGVGQRECCRTEEVGALRRRCDSGTDREEIDDCVAVLDPNGEGGRCGPGDCAEAICKSTGANSPDENSDCGGDGQRACCIADIGLSALGRSCDAGLFKDTTEEGNCVNTVDEPDKCGPFIPFVGSCSKNLCTGLKDVGERCRVLLSPLGTVPCKAGLKCRAIGLTRRACFADFGDALPDEETCNSFHRIKAHKRAIENDKTQYIGFGGSAAAFVNASEEKGLVWGREGCFGCYKTTCSGYEADLEASVFTAVGSLDVNLECHEDAIGDPDPRQCFTNCVIDGSCAPTMIDITSVPDGNYNSFVVGDFTFTSSSPGDPNDMTVLSGVLFTNSFPENTLEITRSDGGSFSFIDLSGETVNATPWDVTGSLEGFMVGQDTFNSVGAATFTANVLDGVGVDKLSIIINQDTGPDLAITEIHLGCGEPICEHDNCDGQFDTPNLDTHGTDHACNSFAGTSCGFGQGLETPILEIGGSVIEAVVNADVCTPFPFGLLADYVGLTAVFSAGVGLNFFDFNTADCETFATVTGCLESGGFCNEDSECAEDEFCRDGECAGLVPVSGMKLCNLAPTLQADCTTTGPAASFALSSGTEDPNDGSLSYEWTTTGCFAGSFDGRFLEAPTLTLPSSSCPSTCNVEVEVSDGSETDICNTMVEFDLNLCSLPANLQAECNGSAPSIGLSSGTSDPSDASLSYQWITGDCSGGDFDNSTAEAPTLSLSSLSACPTSCDVTLQVSSAAGSTTCETRVAFRDTTAPSIDTAAMDRQVECDGMGNTTDFANWPGSLGGAIASDACSTPSWTNSQNEFFDGCGATGSVASTFVATDDCGNSSSTVATFSVQDTIAPMISTQASGLTVECDGAGNGADAAQWLASIGDADAVDTCGAFTWSDDFNGISDGCGATGAVSVVFTATDECGLTSTTGATFTVQDTIAPNITTPASDLTVECDGAGNADDLSLWLDSNAGAQAQDGCGAVSWSHDFSALTPSCGATGSKLVTFTATDECGNSSTTAATFTIEDTAVPDIESNAPTTITPSDAPISFGATAEDACCADDIVVTVESYDCFTFTDKGKRIDKTESCVVELDGDTIRILDSGGVGDIIEWTVSAVDCCGKFSSETFSLTVINPGRNR